MKFYESVPLIAGGLMMIYPGHVSDAIGLVIVALVTAWQVFRRKKTV